MKDQGGKQLKVPGKYGKQLDLSSGEKQSLYIFDKPVNEKRFGINIYVKVLILIISLIIIKGKVFQNILSILEAQ